MSVASVSGPIKVAGAYVFTLRADGLTNLAGTTSAASLAKLPAARAALAARDEAAPLLHAFDLMDFGFNPVLPPIREAGASWAPTWRAATSRVRRHGTARVLGLQTVKVPAGTFQALAVRTTLKQPGFPFGSGVRTSWFAPGKGLVKLVFGTATAASSPSSSS